jgi:hypothetical protein
MDQIDFKIKIQTVVTFWFNIPLNSEHVAIFPEIVALKIISRLTSDVLQNIPVTGQDHAISE